MRKLCPRSFVLFVIDVILDATSLVTGEAAMIRLAAVNQIKKKYYHLKALALLIMLKE